MECPLLTVLTAVIVYGDNKRKCQLPCPAISAHVESAKIYVAFHGANTPATREIN